MAEPGSSGPTRPSWARRHSRMKSWIAADRACSAATSIGGRGERMSGNRHGAGEEAREAESEALGTAAAKEITSTDRSYPKTSAWVPVP